LREKNAADTAAENADLQLAALGTIADIMPLLDENRIIVRKGLEAIAAKPRQGISQLLQRLDLAGRRFDAKDISWKLCPVINAARRMGSAQTAADLFFEKDRVKREKLAEKLSSMNEERKSLEEETWSFVQPLASKNFANYDEKLTLMCSDRINRGITGLIAQRAARQFNVPAIVISMNANICTASLRSARSYNICALLEQCEDLFIDSGGHQAAGGFSMKTDNMDNFLERLKTISRNMEYGEKDDDEILWIDAELPHEYLTPDILKLIDRFEPYGKSNDPLNFLAKKLIIRDINFIGKPESKHIKMTLDAGKYKWAALYWQSAGRVSNKEFGIDDKVDVVFSITRDYYRGNENPQLIISDLRKSEN
jgi:single-stranded-DNA-specific exonuclease